jgi:hypothetical protein
MALTFRPFRPAAAVTLAALALAGCTAADLPAPDTGRSLAGVLVAKTGTAPPARPEGACWAEAIEPAVFETVTEQVMVRPERRAPDGSLLEPAAFRTETRQREVSGRRAVWFRTACAGVLTADLVASLQRALKARGLYAQPVTGTLDAPTWEALRAWQRPRGLDSGTPALRTLELFGLVPPAEG